MSSIDLSTSAQERNQEQRGARVYFGVNGTDVIEYALSLEWILNLLQEYVATHGEDVALWMREEGDTPRLIAFVKPAPSALAVVKMI